MQNRSSKKPRDPSQLVASIVDAATQDTPAGEVEEELQQPEIEGKNPAAVALGRLGGKKGGKARAAKLAPEQRREIARKVARARWDRAEDV